MDGSVCDIFTRTTKPYLSVLQDSLAATPDIFDRFAPHIVTAHVQRHLVSLIVQHFLTTSQSSLSCRPGRLCKSGLIHWAMTWAASSGS